MLNWLLTLALSIAAGLVLTSMLIDVLQGLPHFLHMMQKG
jgi:hypothetical protein